MRRACWGHTNGSEHSSDSCPHAGPCHPSYPEARPTPPTLPACRAKPGSQASWPAVGTHQLGQLFRGSGSSACNWIGRGSPVRLMSTAPPTPEMPEVACGPAAAEGRVHTLTSHTPGPLPPAVTKAAGPRPALTQPRPPFSWGLDTVYLGTWKEEPSPPKPLPRAPAWPAHRDKGPGGRGRGHLALLCSPLGPSPEGLSLPCHIPSLLNVAVGTYSSPLLSSDEGAGGAFRRPPEPRPLWAGPTEHGGCHSVTLLFRACGFGLALAPGGGPPSGFCSLCPVAWTGCDHPGPGQPLRGSRPCPPWQPPGPPELQRSAFPAAQPALPPSALRFGSPR